MFTGIIEETGTVKGFRNNDIIIRADKILDSLKIGDSVSVNGVCLTVTVIRVKDITFSVSPTTASLSNLKSSALRTGEKVNLERALALGGRIGGHIVTGHVDGVTKIINIKRAGDGFIYELIIPADLKNMIFAKGSVALDGISLTISKRLTSSFTVTVIPQTIEETTLQYKTVQNTMHIEADMFARYMYEIISKGGSDSPDGRYNQSVFPW